LLVVGFGFWVNAECYAAACAVATEHAGFVLIGKEPGFIGGLLLGEDVSLLGALVDAEEKETSNHSEEQHTGDDG